MSRSMKIISSITLCILITIANEGWGRDDPEILSIEPLTGPPGTKVTIHGKNFGKRDKVYFNGDRLEVVKRSETRLVVTIPSDATDGRFSVKTFGFRAESGQKFTVSANAQYAPTQFAPSTAFNGPATIRGFSPMAGSPGDRVIIRGKGFGQNPSALEVALGGMLCTVISAKDDEVIIEVPASGKTGPIQVKTGTYISRPSAESFKIKTSNASFSPASYATQSQGSTQVEITGFAPSAGIIGQTITIFGRNFNDKAVRNKVTLAGTKLKVIEASNTALQVKLPRNATSGRFSIEVPNKGSSESSTVFNVVEEIRITGFEPKAGVPGMYVGIHGKGFNNTGLRAFIGNTPLGVRVDSDTEALVAIPPGSANGPFVLMVPGGVKATSNQNFTVEQPVSVRSFTPLAAPVGSRVSIYGAGFDLGKGQTEVILGGQQVPIQSGSTQNMLAVLIPEGASSGPFVIKVKGRGEANTPTAFSVVAPRPSNVARPTVTSAAATPAASPAPEANPTPAAQAKVEPSVLPEDQKPVSMDSLLGIGEAGGGDGDDAAKVAISSIEPVEGPVGETITVNGSGFGEDPDSIRAWLGNKRATVVGVVPDMLMIEVPQGVEGGNVRIKVGDGLTISSKETFKVTATD